MRLAQRLARSCTCEAVPVEPDAPSNRQLLVAGGASQVEGAQTSVVRDGGRHDAGGVLAAGLLQVAEVHPIGAGQADEVLVAEALEVGGTVGRAGPSVFTGIVLAGGLGRPRVVRNTP